MTSQLNISNVEEYLESAIKEINPNLDTRESTAIRDLLLKPLVTFMEPLIEELTRIGDSQSLLNAATMTEPDMDEIVANVFVTRRGGNTSVGSARIYLSNAENNVEIIQGAIFSTLDGLEYQATQRVYVTRQALSLNVEGNFFYLDVPIEATLTGDDYNVAAGQITAMQVPPVNFIRVTNPAATAAGVATETNVELGDRAAVAITVRDLVSEPGIITQILETFTSVQQIQPIGFGDVEMIRDVVTTDGSYLEIGGIQYPPASGTSIGGMVDAYIKPTGRTAEEIIVASMTEYVSLREQETDDPAPSATIQYLPSFKRPAVDITEIEELDAVTLDPTGVFLARGVDWQLNVENDSLTYSTIEKKTIQLLDLGNVGKPYVIRYLHPEDVPAVQDYIYDEANRTVSAYLIAKHAVPVFTSFTVNVTQPSTFTQTEQSYVDALTTFVNAVKMGQRLEASDLIDVIYDTAGSSDDIHVELPFDLNVDEHFVDGTITPGSSQDFIAIDRTKLYIPRDIVVSLTIN